MSKLSGYARALIVSRVERMRRLLESDAPDSLVAAEAGLIGEAGILLDPAGHAERVAVAVVREARDALGLCADHGCDAEVGRAGQEEPRLCDAHELEMVALLKLARSIH